MARGRKRTPTSVLKYRGSWRVKDKITPDDLAKGHKDLHLPEAEKEQPKPLVKSIPLPEVANGEQKTMDSPSELVAPEWLSPEAKREWQFMASKLDMIGLFLTIDRNILGRYCETMVLWIKAKNEVYNISGDGLTHDVGSDRYTKIEPVGALLVMEQLQKTLSAMEEKIGISARARSTIPINAPKPSPKGQAKGSKRPSIKDFKRVS